MKLTGNTIVVTGGSSGIGLELSRVLSENNQVIICGRSAEKLEKAQKLIPSLQVIQCDLSQSTERKRFVKLIEEKYPECNILVNNAAVVHKTNFFSDRDMLSKAELEMNTNYAAPVELTRLFFPLLNRKEKKSKIIFITTGLVYSPKFAYPLYSSTKAGLHSFIQTLRAQMQEYPIEVYEVLMPPVDTPFHQGKAPDRAISPRMAVSEMLKKIEKEKKEIRVGVVKMLYFISRIAPLLASRIVNK